MKETINWKSVGFAALISLVGVSFILADLFLIKSHTNVWISVGCSVLASGLVIILTALLVERKKDNPLDDWKIQKIYSTRGERNREADPNIDKARYCIDGVAFGLSSFRPMYSNKVEHCLKKGVNVRLLTMNPNSFFMREREKEERTVEGSIKKTINDLVSWANSLNEKGYKGKIVVKGYNCMTLDYYWRVDDELYIGPYWYGRQSSVTITYKFLAGGNGFKQYSEYFESLWNDTEIITPLTRIDKIHKKSR